MSLDRIIRALDVAENHCPTETGGGYCAQLAQYDVLALVQENNALRRNNERMAKVMRAQQEQIAELHRKGRDAEAASRNAQTMAAYRHIQTYGDNYDAMREDGPLFRHAWDADGREVTS